MLIVNSPGDKAVAINADHVTHIQKGGDKVYVHLVWDGDGTLNQGNRKNVVQVAGYSVEEIAKALARSKTNPGTIIALEKEMDAT